MADYFLSTCFRCLHASSLTSTDITSFFFFIGKTRRHFCQSVQFSLLSSQHLQFEEKKNIKPETWSACLPSILHIWSNLCSAFMFFLYLRENESCYFVGKDGLTSSSLSLCLLTSRTTRVSASASWCGGKSRASPGGPASWWRGAPPASGRPATAWGGCSGLETESSLRWGGKRKQTEGGAVVVVDVCLMPRFFLFFFLSRFQQTSWTPSLPSPSSSARPPTPSWPPTAEPSSRRWRWVSAPIRCVFNQPQKKFSC